ncbi:RNase J family beta-CASP ribonuclease [Methanofollis formosanus]|uniref:Ribonuclease J n=1 Tax=Methanofollis formosanus TaxID=299308 RepID=A0A8G1A3D1_9EURY|nr:RNase J family beta-CASP ribonuclease [Methanofollis formosanus]QYZ79691.1 RNase J family beta-CASP ribonuclease [Methanofollis formosanus]
MDIEIVAVGGYNEVGRNMTAVRCGKEIVVFDMGLRLDQIMIHEDAELENMHSLDLIEMKAIPDDTMMNTVEGTVKAIVCTHGHLDHIGAIPKLAHRYNAPIIGTPYTIELIKQQIQGEQKFGVNNKLQVLRSGNRYRISQNLTLEFVRMQHSIIDTVMAVLHTKRGAVVYANDFKLDRTPVLGDPPDFARLRQIGKEGVVALVVESTNIDRKGRAPSERIAKELVRDTMTSYEDDKSAIIVSTFSSHISRIKTIAECAYEIGRKPVLLGRSMERYSTTAEQLKLVAFPKNLSVFGNRRTVDRTFRQIMKNGKDKYVPIVTGHQGEPGAILTRMAHGDTPFKMSKGDKVLFSAKVIPNPMNYGQRHLVETLLRMQGARIFDDLHVSGHAYREDHYELIHLLNPQHIIPSHGDIDMTGGYLRFAEGCGYTLNNDIHILRNGQRVLIK